MAEVPITGLEVSLEDIRRAIRIAAENREEYPGFRLLLENVPEEFRPEGLDLAIKLATLPQKREAFGQYRGRFLERVEDLNRQLKAGDLAPLAWKNEVQQELKTLHVQTYALGRDGKWDDISQREWGQIGPRLQKQYRFLRNFSNQVRSQGTDSFTLDYLDDRLQKYGAAARQQFEAGLVADREINPNILPDLPGSGNTSCLARCKCHWAIRPQGNRVYLASWRLGHAEHCVECRQRASAWVDLEIRRGRLVSDYEPINRQ